MGGKALLQWYEADDDKDMDSESECIPKKKKKREISNKPLILFFFDPTHGTCS